MRDENFLNYMAEVNSVNNLGRSNKKLRMVIKIENLLPIIIGGSFLISICWEIATKVKVKI